jgi:hypothetical protein
MKPFHKRILLIKALKVISFMKMFKLKQRKFVQTTTLAQLLDNITYSECLIKIVYLYVAYQKRQESELYGEYHGVYFLHS